MRKVDLAWAGGIVDGEGCIGAYATSGYMRLKLEVNNIDPRMPQMLYEMFGGTRYLHPAQRPNERQLYRWCAHDALAGRIIAQIYPYLVIKKEQAEIALQIAATFPIRTSKPGERRWHKLPKSIKKLRVELAQQLKDLKRVDYSQYYEQVMD